MGKTSIEWTDETWNPVTGCTKISAGCKNCYAEALFGRVYPGRDFTDIRCHEDRIMQPTRWRKHRRVFVNSMSDLFHEDVPEEFLERVFATMLLAGNHIFQVLTKRPERMAKMVNTGLAITSKCRAGLLDKSYWPLPNVWLGVSCEDQPAVDKRTGFLMDTPAAVRFVSLEPLLGPIDDVFLNGLLDWVIVGGESGPNHRSMKISWIRDIVAQCNDAGVPVFVKQESHRYPGKQGDIPDDLWKLKEYPI